MSLIFRFLDWQLERTFLGALKAVLAELEVSDSAVTLATVRIRAMALFDASRALILDKPGARSIRHCALALAAYRELNKITGDRTKAWQLVKQALLRPQKSRVQKLMLWTMNLCRDRLALFASISEKKQLSAYGKGFIFTKHSDNMQSYYATHVHRCLYHEFFKANGAPELTLAFCAFDNLWGDLLQDGRYGVRFTRPTTIAAGDEMCRFEFSRVPRQGINQQPYSQPISEAQ
jgi:hypothetical protein